MVRNLKLIKKAKSFKKKLFSIICQKEKLIRAHCKYAIPAIGSRTLINIHCRHWYQRKYRIQ